MHSVVWIVNPCDCFVWGKCYTFLESLLIGKQNKQCPIFIRQWYILQTRIKKCPKLRNLSNYKCHYNETLNNYSPSVDKRFTRNLKTRNITHVNLLTRMKITCLVCKMVRNYFVQRNFCTLKAYHKMQP